MIYITSYTNPDTDGVAAALGYQTWSRSRFAPEANVIYFGELRAEAAYVLHQTNLANDVNCVASLPDDCSEIVLVDTHAIDQLDRSILGELVTVIVDHHPNGTPESFPNAVIQNELVGASTTLVAERLIESGAKVEPPMALLLAAGIYSNTLEFRAAATTNRDRVAFDTLARLSGWSEGFVRGIRAAQDREARTLGISLLFLDAKTYQTKAGKVTVFQVERPGIIGMFSDQKIAELLEERSAATGLHEVLVLTDQTKDQSQVFSVSRSLLTTLATAIGGHPPSKNSFYVNHLVQRKTHIAPAFQNLPMPEGHSGF